MNITINGKEHATACTTLQALAHELSLPEGGVAMARNNSVVAQGEWEQTQLAPGDTIIVIQASCGG